MCSEEVQSLRNVLIGRVESRFVVGLNNFAFFLILKKEPKERWVLIKHRTY